MPALDMSVNTTDKTAITVYVTINLIYTSIFLGLILSSNIFYVGGDEPILEAAGGGAVPLIARPPFCINFPIFYSSFIIMMGMSGYEFAIINHMRNIKKIKGKKNKSLNAAHVIEALTLGSLFIGFCICLVNGANPVNSVPLNVFLVFAFASRLTTSFIIYSNLHDI